jgi:hypothetical protein
MPIIKLMPGDMLYEVSLPVARVYFVLESLTSVEMVMSDGTIVGA